MTTQRVAVIDIGTSSVNMLIGDGATPPTYRGTVTGLGRSMRNGRLADDDIERTLTALRTYRAVIDGHADITSVHVVATSACRDATNGRAFLNEVHEILGVEPAVLSGADEARLSFAGATSGDGLPDDLIAVVDIGGGSTEFAVGRLGEVPMSWSIDVGAARLLRDELQHDPPLPEELTNAIGLVADHLDDVLREVPLLAEAGMVVGIGSSWVVAAAVEVGLQPFDALAVDGFVLTRSAAEDVFRTLVTESLADRRFNPGLPADRAEAIIGGMCIIVAVMRTLRLEAVTVSIRSLLNGLLAEALVAR